MAKKAPIKRNAKRDGEYGDSSVAFTLTSPVDLARLEGELSSAMNWRKDAGFISEGPADRASAKNPVDLWVLRDDVDATTLRQVVADHDPTPEPNLLLELVDKAREGEDLTDDEVQTALRGLLLRLGDGL